MVKASGIALLSVPEVPENWTVAGPAAALEAALSVNGWADPAATVAFAGEIVTPAGNPFTAM